MHKDKWKDNASCFEYDTDIFFDKYEEDEVLRVAVDNVCSHCPVSKQCFAVGVSTKEWGVWGGIYLEGGAISKEFNSHKTKEDWADTWQYLTTESSGL
jgi:hypothetical protein